jgi:rifampicin phosphotransferase
VVGSALGFAVPDDDGFDRAAAVAAITSKSKAMGRWIVDDDPSPRYPIYTRANIGEVFPDVVMPLSWTLWGIQHTEPGWRRGLAELGAVDLDEFTPNVMEVLGCFGGYGYLNVSVSRIFGVRTPGMSAEAIDASFFGEQPDVPPYAPRDSDMSAKHSERLGAMLGTLFTTTDLPELIEMRAQVNALRAARPDIGAMSDAELLARTRAVSAAHWEPLWVRHIVATYHSMIPTGAIAGICAAVGKGEMAADIMGAAGDVDSALPAKALWALGRTVRASAALTASFDAGLSGLQARLIAAEPAFAEQFASFLREFGCRGSQEWEMRSATWEIAPEAPLAAIDRLRFAADHESPDERMKARLDARQHAVETVRALLGDTPEADQFNAAAAVAGTYFAARERTKTTCVILVHEMRMMMWELGRRMTAKGHFDSPDQFALLTNAEWDDVLADPTIARPIIVAREAELRKLSALVPPFIINGTVPPLASWERRDAAQFKRAQVGDLLTGQPGCAGLARGVARIVRDPAEPGDLGPGDILVAPHTDPSWTPLFASAAGIVVNVGAAISHAVIVARELGVPCAVSVTGATEQLVDGMIIEVDGAAGTVRIIDAA